MDIFTEMHRRRECQCTAHRESNDAHFPTSLLLPAEQSRGLNVAQRLCKVEVVHEVSGLGHAPGNLSAVQVLRPHASGAKEDPVSEIWRSP